MRTKTVWFFAVLLLAAGGYSEASGIDVASTINNAILNQLPSQNSTASGPSWATFGVVLNGRDAVHQPEQYPDINNRRTRYQGFRPDGDQIQNQLIWGQFGNTTESDAFGGAYIGRVGKGFLGAQLSFETDKHTENDLNQFGGGSTSTNDQNVTNRDHSTYLGYGWQAGDKVNHGVGLGYACDTFRDDDFGQGTVSGFENIFHDNATHTYLRYGAKIKPSDRFSYTAELKYIDSEVNLLNRNTSLDGTGNPLNSFTFIDLQLDAESVMLGQRYNWYPNDTWEYQIRWNYLAGSVDLINVPVEYQDVMGTVIPFNNVTDDDIDVTNTAISGTVGWHENQLNIYGGIDVNQWQVETGITGDFNSPMLFLYQQDDSDEFTTYTPHISMIYEFSSKWAITAGARYQYSDENVRDVFRNIDVVTPGNTSVFFDNMDWTSSETSLRAGAEFRNEKVILDFNLDSGSLNGQDSLDTRQVRFSVRLGF